MDFIERIFHVAPDGGNGTLELKIVLALVIVPLATLLLVKMRSLARARDESNPRP
jgi:hypothetical protein